MCNQYGKPRRYCSLCAAGTLIQLSRLRKGITHFQSHQQIAPPLSAQKLQSLTALRLWGAPGSLGSEKRGSEKRGGEKRGGEKGGGAKRGRGRPRGPWIEHRGEVGKKLWGEVGHEEVWIQSEAGQKVVKEWKEEKMREWKRSLLN